MKRRRFTVVDLPSAKKLKTQVKKPESKKLDDDCRNIQLAENKLILNETMEAAENYDR